MTPHDFLARDFEGQRHRLKAVAYRMRTDRTTRRVAGSPSARSAAAVAAWRDTPYFTDAERAALALAEAVTRLADTTDVVPDKVGDEATGHYSESELAALLVTIATVNVWNRLNVASRQVAGGAW